MIFLSTLIAMTEGVPQKVKVKSILVMRTTYVLNIMRLVMFYPIALTIALLIRTKQVSI